jgi:hypothetical protein
MTRPADGTEHDMLMITLYVMPHAARGHEPWAIFLFSHFPASPSVAEGLELVPCRCGGDRLTRFPFARQRLMFARKVTSAPLTGKIGPLGRPNGAKRCEDTRC